MHVLLQHSKGKSMDDEIEKFTCFTFNFWSLGMEKERFSKTLVNVRNSTIDGLFPFHKNSEYVFTG
jgi:hypothetical protein